MKIIKGEDGFSVLALVNLRPDPVSVGANNMIESNIGGPLLGLSCTNRHPWDLFKNLTETGVCSDLCKKKVAQTNSGCTFLGEFKGWRDLRWHYHTRITEPLPKHGFSGMFILEQLYEYATKGMGEIREHRLFMEEAWEGCIGIIILQFFFCSWTFSEQQIVMVLLFVICLEQKHPWAWILIGIPDVLVVWLRTICTLKVRTPILHLAVVLAPSFVSISCVCFTSGLVAILLTFYSCALIINIMIRY